MRWPLVLRRNGTFWGHQGLGDDVGSRSVGVEGGQGATRRLPSSSDCLCAPGLPVATPRRESILFIVDAVVDLPLECEEPLKFHFVQLSDGDVADFGPRFVLESVVIQELASQKESNGEEARHLATAGSVHASRRQHPHPRRQIVETQKNG